MSVTTQSPVITTNDATFITFVSSAYYRIVVVFIGNVTQSFEHLVVDKNYNSILFLKNNKYHTNRENINLFALKTMCFVKKIRIS